MPFCLKKKNNQGENYHPLHPPKPLSESTDPNGGALLPSSPSHWVMQLNSMQGHLCECTKHIHVDVEGPTLSKHILLLL